MRLQDNLGLDIFLSGLCRDDRCPRVDVHKQHAINDTRRRRSQRRRSLGWVDDPLEPVDLTVEMKEPTDVLEESVMKVTSLVIPKSAGMIMRDLTHDYGYCGDRRLQRCLKRMSEKKRLLRIDLSYLNNGGDLRAYLHPGSHLASDPLLIYEQLTNEFESSSYDHEKAVYERALRGAPEPSRQYSGARGPMITFGDQRSLKRLSRVQRLAAKRPLDAG
jgi:hypothetical protein